MRVSHTPELNPHLRLLVHVAASILLISPPPQLELEVASKAELTPSLHCCHEEGEGETTADPGVRGVELLRRPRRVRVRRRRLAGHPVLRVRHAAAGRRHGHCSASVAQASQKGGNVEQRYAGDSEGGGAEAAEGGGGAARRDEEADWRRGPRGRVRGEPPQGVVAQGGQSRGRGPLRDPARHALPQAEETAGEKPVDRRVPRPQLRRIA